MGKFHSRKIYKKVTCQSCDVLVINNVICHEAGCPDAWRDYTYECKECGQKFKMESREESDEFCSPHCYRMYNGFQCDCESCIEFAAEMDEINTIINSNDYEDSKHSD